MGRTNKAPGSAQDGQEAQRMDTEDAQVQETAADSAQEVPASAWEIIGPEREDELLGCRDEAALAGGVLHPYMVTARGGLRLRQAPRLDAPVIAVLPCGAGVFANDGPGESGWRQVVTGRLKGWMMAEHLEALPLPELDDGAG